MLTKRTEAWQKAQRAADEREPRHPPVVVALDRRNEVEEVFTVERIKEIKKDTLEYLWAGRTLVVDARLGGLDASGLLAADADGPPPTLDGDPQDADWTRRAQFRIRRAHHDAPSEEDWPLAYRWAEASDEDEATGSVR